MTDLVGFLHARLDEAEAAQHDDNTNWHDSSCESVPSRWRSETGPCDCGIPQRVLADIAAKHAIVDLHVDRAECTRCEWFDDELYPCDTLKLLATGYTDHQDYQQEWKP